MPDPTGPGWRDFDAGNVNFHVLNRARTQLDSLPRKEAAFIEPMECLSVSKLPEGSQWVWESLMAIEPSRSSPATT
jgi:hypothetical protein